MSILKCILKNWRCIDFLDIELAPVTLLIGGNASGKSSILYAIYFVTKVLETGVEHVNELAKKLYGVEFREVVRLVDGKPQFPLEIRIEDEARSVSLYAESLDKIDMKGERVWSRVHLLPSQRLFLIKLIQHVDRLMQTTGRGFTEIAMLSLMRQFMDMFSSLFTPPPGLVLHESIYRLFLKDQDVIRIRVERLGELEVHMLPISYVKIFEYVDEATGQRFSADLAPDGALDLLLIKAFLERVDRNDLLLIEEPEIHKNPVMLIDIAEDITKAVERGVHVICSTHSDIFVQAVARSIKDPGKIAVYYLTRSREFPWTTARRIKVYEDGTLEEFPGAEEIVARLF